MNEMDIDKLFRLKLSLELEKRGMNTQEAHIISKWLPECLIDDALSKFIEVDDFIEKMWGGKI